MSYSAGTKPPVIAISPSRATATSSDSTASSNTQKMSRRYEPTHRSLRAQRRDRNVERKPFTKEVKQVSAGEFKNAIAHMIEDGTSSKAPKDVEPVNSIPAEAMGQEGAETLPAMEAEKADSSGKELAIVNSPKDPNRSRGSDSFRDAADEQPSKRSRNEQDDRISSRNSADSTSGNGSWEFKHTRPGSVIDDTNGMASLLRRMKPTGWTFPTLKEIEQKDELLTVAHHLGQFLSAMNVSFIGYEEKLKKVPNQKELDETKEIVKAVMVQLKEAKDEAAKAEGKNEDLKLENLVLQRQVKELNLYKRTSEQHITNLMVEKTELTERNRELEANKAVTAKKAFKEGRREMLSAVQAKFVLVKEKFEKKTMMGKAGAAVQELESNIMLLEDIIKEEITDLKKEHADLAEELPRAIEALDKATVSDFSVTKFDWPQISESSGTPMLLDPKTGAPEGINQFGTNLGSSEALGKGGGDPEQKGDAKEGQSATVVAGEEEVPSDDQNA